MERYLGNDLGSSWSSGVGVSNSSHSWDSRISSNMSNSRSSSCIVGNSNWGLSNSMDWGSMSSHNSLGGVGLNCLVVDVGSLNNLIIGKVNMSS